MPAIAPGSLVLVTGASGFIAVHTVKAFLEAGYKVRGTVRSPAKGEYLKNLFSGAPFEYIIVDDIAKPGAFDQAVVGVVGVAHTASPFHFNVSDPAELITPAVQGTVGVLQSIQKFSPNVQRVVVTSSCAAVMDATLPRPKKFDEKDWNDASIRIVEKQGKNASAIDMYRASKTLAEKALWQFIKEEKPNFDGVTINPPMVYGPILQQVTKTSDLNQSNQSILEWFTGNKKQSDIPSFAAGNWVDVRDVAQAHVRALAVPEAGGERFIVGNGPGSPIDFVLSFEKHYPERTTYPKGDASLVDEVNRSSNVFDGSKAVKILGIKYHDIDTTVQDTVQSLIERLGV